MQLSRKCTFQIFYVAFELYFNRMMMVTMVTVMVANLLTCIPIICFLLWVNCGLAYLY